MKTIIPIILIMTIAFTATASTSITSPLVSGHWTMAGSPYLVFNDISVDAADTLTVDPGVEVIFQGNYMIAVQGSLIAAGTAVKPINFHINDTTGWYDAGSLSGGWVGIQFGQAMVPSAWKSTFEYCNVSDMKSGGVIAHDCSMVLKNCNFFHNNASPVGGDVDTLQTFEIGHCSMHDNIGYALQMSGYGGGSGNVHDNLIYNNQSDLSTVFILFTDLMFSGNTVYNNVTTGPVTFQSVICINNSNGTIKHNTIHHNWSQFDAALLCVCGVWDINSNFICNNQHVISATCGATDGGGGLHVSSNGASVGERVFFNIRNNVIANNLSPFCGGAIKVFWSDVSITNNQIVNNTGAYSGAIHLTSDTFSAVIKNNLFAGNKTTDLIGQPNVHVDLAKNITYEHNWTQNTFSNDFFAASGSYNLMGDTNTNVIGTTPGMINPTAVADVNVSALASDFRLLPGSPCIDRGDTAGTLADIVDYAGYQRVYGSAIDIGAFEYSPAEYAHTSVPSMPASRINIEAFPNPASADIYLSTDEAEGTITLTDITGKIVAARNVEKTITFFDIHSLPRGVYIATWCNGKGNKATQKVLVQ